MTQAGTVLREDGKANRLNDPVLQELWAVKANLNARANYSVDELVRRLDEQRPRLQALRAQLSAAVH
jgi:division protein CdvB (Snf7/Vps24/ESCRT-III family)